MTEHRPRLSLHLVRNHPSKALDEESSRTTHPHDAHPEYSSERLALNAR